MHLGRRTKCPKCQAQFVVQAMEAEAIAAGRAAEPPAPSQEVTYVGVNCQLCGTRLYGTLADVGKPLKCPDCYTHTVLPAPSPPRPRAIPPAMLGEQYELWEGEDQPWGSKLAAAQATMIRVQCELCDTLQYVAPDQVGTSVVCPDCGHATRVRAPKLPAAAPQHHEPEYELEPSQVDDTFTTPAAPSIYTRLQDFESKSQEEQEREISRVATNRRARPRMPRWPLLSGWRAFLLAPGVLSRWLSLSVMIAAIGSLAAFAFPMVFSGFGALAGLPLLCGAAALGALWYAASAACAVAIVTESSEGNNQIMAWPSTNPTDWMGEAVYLLVAASASAAPGYLAAQLAGSNAVVIAAAMLASVWIAFPVMHLSTLEGSSPFALFMPGVAGSLRSWPGTWLLFYLLSAAGFAAVGAVVLLLVRDAGASGLLLATVPLVGGAGAYFRLLGRLAWRIRDDSPARPAKAAPG